MATKIKVTPAVSSDSLVLSFTDTTGEFPFDKTGYLHPGTGEVNGVSYTVTVDDVPDDITPSSGISEAVVYVSVNAATEVEVPIEDFEGGARFVIEVPAEKLGVEAIDDGIITYRLSFNDGEYVTTGCLYNLRAVSCCVSKMQDKEICSCSGSKEGCEGRLYASALLKAIKYAYRIKKLEKANALLVQLQEICKSAKCKCK